MWPWVMSFKRSHLLAAIAFSLVLTASAKVFLIRDAALAELFPDAEITRETVYLEPAQRKQMEALAGTALSGDILYRYRAEIDSVLQGEAYMDAHRVRTLPETLIVALLPDGSVKDVKVMVFNEPQEYLCPPKWYQQFVGRKLNDDLALKKGIDGMTGATLTARATTQSVRRVLAIRQVLSAPK
ncbi:MAG: hypothetical protein ACI9TH_000120 [Kiritimatiellia bacterium]|jgi:hypothetical protein